MKSVTFLKLFLQLSNKYWVRYLRKKGKLKKEKNKVIRIWVIFADMNEKLSESRENSASKRDRQRRAISELSESKSHKKKIDASYKDPLGPAMERPKTGARRNTGTEDDFDDFEVDENLLPE